MAEELKAAYSNGGLEYDFKALSFSKNEQKEDWYLKVTHNSLLVLDPLYGREVLNLFLFQINPNGRIPAIVHHRPDGTDFSVFESSAIILYLVQRFDPEHKLSFKAGTDEASEALQWIFFSVSGTDSQVQSRTRKCSRFTYPFKLCHIAWR